MREIIYNNDNLIEEDITEISLRTKALLINNENIYLGNGSDIYQFPGGHLEDGETIIECIKREILEEVGIELDVDKIEEPFMRIIFIDKDYPKKGINRKTIFNYFIIETDDVPNIDKVNYTEEEKNENFRIDIIPLNKAIDIIRENIPKNEKNKLIAPYMVEVIEEYLKWRYN